MNLLLLIVNRILSSWMLMNVLPQKFKINIKREELIKQKKTFSESNEDSVRHKIQSDSIHTKFLQIECQSRSIINKP